MTCNRKSHGGSTEKALCLEVYSGGPPSDEDSDLGINSFQDGMRPQDCKSSEKGNKSEPEHQLLRWSHDCSSPAAHPVCHPPTSDYLAKEWSCPPCPAPSPYWLTPSEPAQQLISQPRSSEDNCSADGSLDTTS